MFLMKCVPQVIRPLAEPQVVGLLSEAEIVLPPLVRRHLTTPLAEPGGSRIDWLGWFYECILLKNMYNKLLMEN